MKIVPLLWLHLPKNKNANTFSLPAAPPLHGDRHHSGMDFSQKQSLCKTDSQDSKAYLADAVPLTNLRTIVSGDLPAIPYLVDLGCLIATEQLSFDVQQYPTLLHG